MSLIVLAGTADFATQEGRDECLASSAKYQAPARSDEPGCLAYYFAPDPVVATRMVVWELWADSATLNAHFQHPNYKNMGAHLGRFGIASADFKKYRVDHVEPVYDATGTPRGDFFQLKP
jgi:quinol monooxygenase YgiN